MLVPRGGARALSVIVTPLTGDGSQPYDGGAVRAVFFGDPDGGMDDVETMVRRLYALTPAEARLVVQLLQGQTLQEIAGELGVSVTTARTHLRSVFSKTGTRRQSELVRVLLTGPAQLGSA